MKDRHQQIWNGYFLDVTEFILTGPNQSRNPHPSDTPHIEPADRVGGCSWVAVCDYLASFNLLQVGTPMSIPVLIEVEIELSPYFKEFFQNPDEATIEFLNFSLDYSQSQINTKLQNCIPQVIQQQDEEDNQQDQSQLSPDSPHNHDSQPSIPQIQSSKLNINYFRKYLHQLQTSKADTPTIKHFLVQYLTEDNVSINFNTDDIQALIPIVEHNLRQVGSISWLERKHKVKKYLQKKQIYRYQRKRRTWRKKTSYDSRKKVADGRLRVKGKFVTKQQACKMVGIQECKEEELKALLEAKFGKSNVS